MSVDDRPGVGDQSGRASSADGDLPVFRIIGYDEYFNPVNVAGGQKTDEGWKMLRHLEVGEKSPFDITDALRDIGVFEALVDDISSYFSRPGSYTYSDTRPASSINRESVKFAVIPEFIRPTPKYESEVAGLPMLRGYGVVAWTTDTNGNQVRAGRFYNRDLDPSKNRSYPIHELGLKIAADLIPRGIPNNVNSEIGI